MSDPSFNSVMLQKYIDGWQAGDRSAADELLRVAGVRLEKLARRMCRSFRTSASGPRRDVLQNSLIRLLRTLQSMRPVTTRDFFNLAASTSAGSCSTSPATSAPDLGALDQPAAAFERNGRAHAEPASPQPQDFDVWARFHEAVDQLPAEEREVVGLVFYHGWTQARIAELFQVDERTIRRRWAAACQRLREIVGGSIPNG